MSFSVLAWNVRKFGGKRSKVRVERVAEFIHSFDEGRGPDVFGLFEIEQGRVVNALYNDFPDYDFYMTDGPQSLEMVVAARHGVFGQASFVVKREFRGAPHLRPGAMLTVKYGNYRYPLLFLHIDSGRTPADFGNRTATISKIYSLERALTKQGNPRLIALGDFNTMGMAYPRDNLDNERVSEEEEIAIMAKQARSAKMMLADKTHPRTWHSSSRSQSADLDHVLHSKHVELVEPVLVRGWVDMPTVAKRRQWIERYSDHSALFLKVKGK